MAVKSPEAKARRKAYQREYRRLNHEREKPLLRAWTDQNLGHRHTYARKRRLSRYGITDEQFAALVQEQNYHCPICGVLLEEPNWGRRGTGVHGNCSVVDHKDNKVRGILCSRCNVGLGMFRDNVDFLKNAILYLEKQENNRVST